MSHKLHFDQKAIKQLEKLPKEITQRIIKKLQEAKHNPHRFFEELTNIDAQKLRVGEYRVIADITQEHIIVLFVAHRKNVYKRY